ncbi:MAG: biotin-dependent carboxyltransferase [Actinomycetia bacterium]|nr:biotin-dependent carboxyltransferase [Actinomycetes bacterium]
MGVRVLKPGMATTVQDQGRPGYYSVGIPPSGSLDQYSSLAANLLVGNDESAAVLECTYLGPQLLFEAPTVVAVTGADLPPLLNGEPRPTWESFEVSEGDVLSFDFLESGARAYIAFTGGVDVPPVLGSRSTYTLGSMGGVGGRVLAEGDWIPIGDSNGGVPGRTVPETLRPQHPSHREIRVMMGLFDHRLTAAGRETFLGTDWRLTPVADRTGFRYQGAELEFRDRVPPFGAGSDPSNIVDAPYPIGSIQVPGGIEPIVLHRDAVSGGGYVMVATVIGADMDQVGQSAPNITTRFVEVDLEDALQARRDQVTQADRLREVQAP